MDEPLASLRWAYAFVWLLRPTSRRGAGVEASGGEVVGCRFCSKSHCAQTARAGPEKIATLPRSPFGRTIIFFNDFYSVEKRVTRSRERR